MPNQLSAVEKALLKEAVDLEKQKYQEIANQRFDSDDNWSIMIKGDCNDERNEIMRRFKFQQLR